MDSFDLSFGINPQALAVLHMLMRTELEFLQESHPHADPDLQTRVWYNGRERGIAVGYTPTLGHNYIYITFAECRSSDQIVTWSWFEAHRLLNPPVGGVPEHATGTEFPYGAINEVAEHVLKLIDDHHAKYAPKSEEPEGP